LTQPQRHRPRLHSSTANAIYAAQSINERR